MILLISGGVFLVGIILIASSKTKDDIWGGLGFGMVIFSIVLGFLILGCTTLKKS